MFDQLGTWVVDAAMTPWAFVVLFVLIIIDAVFPAVPSESILISLSSVYIGERPVLLAALFATGYIACWLGDNLAFWVGGRSWMQNNPITRRPRIVRLLEWAKKELFRHGSSIIIAGRFIPGGRIAIHVACGMVGFSARRFRGVTLISALAWTMYSVLIGTVAGAWFADNQVLGVVIAVILGMALGPVVDRVVRAVTGISSPDG